MGLFNRQKSNIPAELQPYYDAPQPGPGRWAGWLIRGAALLLIVLLLALLIRWSWHELHKVKTPAKPSVSSSQSHKATTNQKSPSNHASPNASSLNQPATSSQTAPGTSTATSTDAAPSSSSTASATPSQTSQQSAPLANTGPGDTVALFAAASIFGVVLYQLRIRQKVSR